MSHFDISIHNSALLVIDMQEAFVKVIPSIVPDENTTSDKNCGHYCQLLIQGATLLDIPIIFSEQYPRGLGSTLEPLRQAAVQSDATTNAIVYEKTHFSCLDDLTLREHLNELGRCNIIVCGIEAHICVLGTSYDLLQRGYNTLVAADAVASRIENNRIYALQALQVAGALCLPVESLLFRLQRQAGTGAFQALSTLLR